VARCHCQRKSVLILIQLMRSRNAEMHAHGPAGPLLPPASVHLPPVPPFCPFILYIVVQRTVLLIDDTLQK